MLVWTVGLAGGFALLSTLRPAWSATSRALAALGGSAAALVAVTVASGGMGRLDGEARAQFGALVTAWQKQVSERLPDAGTAESLRAAGERTVEQGIAVLPAVLALQLLLSLALAWWIFVRLA
ncbi:MAG: hypothetical protein M3483_06635, partial [Gemmatimonadota bacterium]|nr:hypothetical protein [Gemmatimonadota bacterium]